MKGLVFVLSLAGLGCLMPGCMGSSDNGSSAEGKPDLVVTTFKQRGPAVVNKENRAVVPVHVVVKNQGNADADVFKVSTSYKVTRYTHVVAFTVPKQSHPWFPYIWGALEAGNELVLEGIVTFDASLHQTTVSLFAIADSCSGEESMPAYCRIEESDENNNRSIPIEIDVP